ncbi:DUF3179 domain-containing (seleno)protein [Wukongibacter baidiensis]|uniref:DUF3179 domain-containing (seleno)protein n=1 Tax=Wukongibacter baidiensis TaxID=1723361 RepID=UPI003D7FEC23
MTPIVDGEVLKFEPTGVYNGLLLLSDTKTRSFWNHITGECVYGHYKGRTLEINNLLHTTLEAALEDYDNIKIAISKQPIHVKIINSLMKFIQNINKDFMPPSFKNTMEEEDNRLDRMDTGLGIWNENKSKFYRYEDIENNDSVIVDEFDGKKIIIYIDKTSSMPVCRYIIGEVYKWENKEIRLLDGKILDEMPMQLLTRWYGFSLTFKNCEIYR